MIMSNLNNAPEFGPVFLEHISYDYWKILKYLISDEIVVSIYDYVALTFMENGAGLKIVREVHADDGENDAAHDDSAKSHIYVSSMVQLRHKGKNDYTFIKEQLEEDYAQYFEQVMKAFAPHLDPISKEHARLIKQITSVHGGSGLDTPEKFVGQRSGRVTKS